MDYDNAEEEFEYWDMFGEQKVENPIEEPGHTKTLGFDSVDEMLNE